MSATLDAVPGTRGSGVIATDERPAVRVRGLWKRYGHVDAVKGIDFDVAAGEVFGLIGPDGAGKTSTFQILGGVMPATAGEVEIFGRSAQAARPLVGYLTQAFSLYPDLSVTENLRYVGELRRLPLATIEARGSHYLGLFDMERFRKRLAGRLSGGMKQKLALACALIAEPRLLLLDEPTTGVDPVSRREFWDTLAALATEGMTIVVATPYLDEAERCTRVALVHEGVIHDTGTPAELRARPGLERLEVRAAELERAEAVLSESPGIEDVQRFGDRLDVMVRDARAGERAVRDALAREGLTLDGLHDAAPTLENSFVTVLRALGSEQHVEPFPYRRRFREHASDAVAIGASGLRKSYGAFDAVKHVDVRVGYGEIYGLLGANGAGKTTTIKMLCGLIDPTEGEVTLAGERELVRSSDVRQRIGYMSQKFSLYDDLTIEENLDFFAGVYQVPRAERAEKKRWVVEAAGLAGRERLMTGELPGGWKQRVAFGCAIMHEPSVLFLDEPTSGVDPLARRAIWRMVNNLADRGVAILITTHYLEEAEQCNRLGFMVAGEIVAQGTPTGVKADQGGHLIEAITDRPQLALNLLKESVDRWRVSLFGDRLHLVVDESVEAGIAFLRERLGPAGIRVLEAYEESYTLEDVFIAVVEKARQRGQVVEE